MKYFIPAFIVMILIYFFSAMPSDESSLQHSRVIAFFAYLGIDLFQILGSNAVFWVRKTAHFIIFGTLSLTYFYGFLKNQIPRTFLLAFLFTFFYAITDETHQYFVPGRSAQYTDVLIDSLGALFFLSIAQLLLSYHKAQSP
ncbi:MAG: teicoplanin resistance protein VanZ [Bacteroidia bacterium]|jgi:VanZ family protein|nr:MAG: teicoplanin resistance protein VanZ [Bacteroidia bacterium]